MGTLTLDEMKAEMRASVGNRTDLDSRLTNIINLAQMRIARKHRWEELEALYTDTTAYTGVAADDKFLALPTNLRDAYSVRLIDGANSRKLIRVPNRTWDKKIPEPEYFATGRPKFYTLRRNVMELWKVPDAAYNITLFAVYWPTALSASTDVSDLDQKDDMIISLANSWVFMTLQNEEKARKWWAMYANMMNDSVDEEVEKPDLDFAVGAKLSEPGLGGGGPYYQDPFVRSTS